MPDAPASGPAVVSADAARALFAAWPRQVRRLVAVFMAVSIFDRQIEPVTFDEADRGTVRPLLDAGLLVEFDPADAREAHARSYGDGPYELPPGALGVLPTPRLWGAVLAYLGEEDWDGAVIGDFDRQIALIDSFLADEEDGGADPDEVDPRGRDGRDGRGGGAR